MECKTGLKSYMNIERCFEILELDMDASAEDVKKARRDLIFIWHPDRVTSKNPRLKKKAEKKMREIAEAYEHISAFLEGKPLEGPTEQQAIHNADESLPQSYPLILNEADFYFRQGIAYGESGEYRKAVKCFTQVISLRPGNADAYYNRGVANNRAGNYKEAIKDFTRAICICPTYSAAYIYRGYIYAELDKPEPACKDFQKAHELGNSIGIEWAKKKKICF